MHKNLTLNEVGLREGFQNLRRVYSTDLKLTVLSGLLQAGVRHIQLGSFVHPEILPQMADAELLFTLFHNMTMLFTVHSSLMSGGWAGPSTAV